MFNSPAIPELSVKELKKALDAGQKPYLLDVRRPDEHARGNIGGKLIPVDQLPSRMSEITADKDAPLVVYCRSGARSGRAVQFLIANGYTGAVNLRGGMLAWSAEIDSSLVAE